MNRRRPSAHDRNPRCPEDLEAVAFHEEDRRRMGNAVRDGEPGVFGRDDRRASANGQARQGIGALGGHSR